MQVTTLTAALATAQTNASSWSSQYYSVNASLTSCYSMLTVCTSNMTLVNEVAAMASQLASTNTSLSQATAAMTAKDGQIASLTASLAAANSQLTTANADLSASQAQVASLTTNLAATTGQLTTANSAVSTLTANLATTTSQLSTSQANLTAAQAEIARLTALLSVSQSDLAAANGQVAALQSALNTSVAGSVTALLVGNLTAAQVRGCSLVLAHGVDWPGLGGGGFLGTLRDARCSCIAGDHFDIELVVDRRICELHVVRIVSVVFASDQCRAEYVAASGASDRVNDDGLPLWQCHRGDGLQRVPRSGAGSADAAVSQRLGAAVQLGQRAHAADDVPVPVQ